MCQNVCTEMPFGQCRSCRNMNSKLLWQTSKRISLLRITHCIILYNIISTDTDVITTQPTTQPTTQTTTQPTTQPTTPPSVITMPGDHMHGIVMVRCSIWLPLLVVMIYLLIGLYPPFVLVSRTVYRSVL